MWTLSKSYDYYFLEGSLLHAYEDEYEIGCIMEILALNNDRIKVSKAALEKFEKKNFKNWYELTYYEATQAKYCKSFKHILKPKTFDYVVPQPQEPVLEEENPADRDRQENTIHADRNRLELPIPAEADRQNIAE
jgi:hypothetical protein